MTAKGLRICALVGLLVSGLATAAPAVDSLVPFTAKYASNYGVLRASGQRELAADQDGAWRIEHSARLLLVTVTERSTFVVTEGVVKPLAYQFANPLSSKRSMSLQFDWPANRVTEMDSKTAIALQPRVFDKLSYQMQLKMDVCAAPDAFTGAEYTVVDRSRLKRYRITPLKREVLETSAGPLDTLRLRQVRADKKDDEPTYIWLAIDWHCLVARVEQLEDGKMLSLKLVEAVIDGRQVEGSH